MPGRRAGGAGGVEDRTVKRRYRYGAGFTLVEVVVCSFILAVLLLSLAGAFSSNLMTTVSSRNLTEGAAFLESTMQSLDAQGYDGLLAMNGNRIFDDPVPANASFAVDLSVWESAVDLLQVRAVLTDLRTNRELVRVVTRRSRR